MLYIFSVLTLITMIGLTSCTERGVSKTVTRGNNEVHVQERTYKDGEVIEEHGCTIVYDTPEEAWKAVHG